MPLDIEDLFPAGEQPLGAAETSTAEPPAADAPPPWAAVSQRVDQLAQAVAMLAGRPRPNR